MMHTICQGDRLLFQSAGATKPIQYMSAYYEYINKSVQSEKVARPLYRITFTPWNNWQYSIG